MLFTRRTIVTILGAVLVACLLCLTPTQAWAADHAISIDPGAYQGRYLTTGTGYLTGPQSVTLAEGTHVVHISTGARFSFEVDAAGDVTSLNASAATGSGNVLQFHTTTVTIGPGAFAGQYFINGVTAYLQGVQSIALLPGLDGYDVRIGGSARLFFDVGATGVVTSQVPSAATGGSNVLNLHTRLITIDPGTYEGSFTLIRIGTTYERGIQQFALPPGLQGYDAVIAGSARLKFDIDAQGLVSPQIPAAAIGAVDRLTFQGTDITIDPDAFTGSFTVVQVGLAYERGVQTFTLVRGLSNFGISGTVNFKIDVDDAGNVHSQVPSAAQGMGATLRFTPSSIKIDPGAFTGNYIINGVDLAFAGGERCVQLLPGVSGYRLYLQTGGFKSFGVDALGHPSPASLAMEQGSEIIPFALSRGDCGSEVPTADAGPDQSSNGGATVDLDGSASFDDQTASGDLLYAWAFVTRPAGSSATLSGANTATPSFVADALGTYGIALVVTDEDGQASATDDVVISSENLAPTADAGLGRTVHVGEAAILDGLGSSDPEGAPIAYLWAILSAPEGSAAELDDDTSPLPSFVPDVEGTYVIALVVRDAFTDSAPDEVTVTAIGLLLAQDLLRQACNLIQALPNASFDAKGHRKSLCNELARVITFIQKDQLDQAAEHLASAIERVDGCALRGVPDPKGKGQPKAADHIVVCADQLAVHDLLSEALAAFP